jgi:RNA polymerase sigma factor (sigma-70 family)
LPADPAAVLGLLYRAAGAEALAETPDADLLRRFAAASGAAEAAFAALLRRHGPAVWGVCRAHLRDPHDAEDAFQATFLVLATRAGALALRGPLGPWLAGVARRLCRRARAAAARRRRHERRAARPRLSADPAAEPDTAEAVRGAVLRLPERLRAPVALCDLDGLTYQQAAERLGVSPGAVRNRLARGRRRLRAALQRLGLAPAAVLGPRAVPAPPGALVARTARAAVRIAAGSAGGVPASVLKLMTGGLLMTKLKAVGLSLLAAGVLIAGAVGLGAQHRPPTTGPAPQNRDGTEVPGPVAINALTPEAARAADPAEGIARLAREAKRLQEAGDVKGARQALRRLHAAAFDWEDALAEAGPGRNLGRNLGERPSGVTRIAPMELDVGTAPENRATTRAPGGPNQFAPRARPAAGGGGDVEARLRDLEEKMDRLLRALERPPDTRQRPLPDNPNKQ